MLAAKTMARLHVAWCFFANRRASSVELISGPIFTHEKFLPNRVLVSA